MGTECSHKPGGVRELLTSGSQAWVRMGILLDREWAGDGPGLGSSSGVELEQEVAEGSLHLSLDLRGSAGGVCIAYDGELCPDFVCPLCDPSPPLWHWIRKGSLW